MKKLILIFSILILAFSVKAQDRTISRTLTPDQTLYDYDGQAADTLGTTVDTLAFVFTSNKSNPVLHNIEFNADPNTIDGTYTVDVKLQGRTFTSDSWSDIDATNTGVDATSEVSIDFTTDLTEIIDTLATTSHPFYRQFRILVANNTVTGLDAGEQLTVDYVYVKFYIR
ncbi:MAG: hypothetical protein K9J21_07315 [Bacteroidales bacterium]|nr:hypothetical protein [Bacteroidales bacterium]